MISCKEATLLIEKKQAAKLSLKERLQLRFHNFICKACAQYGIQSAWIDKMLKNMHTQDQLTAEEKNTIQQQLNQ
jgi:DNA replication initiation complex subunit (GINS family)